MSWILDLSAPSCVPVWLIATSFCTRPESRRIKNFKYLDKRQQQCDSGKQCRPVIYCRFTNITNLVPSYYWNTTDFTRPLKIESFEPFEIARVSGEGRVQTNYSKLEKHRILIYYFSSNSLMSAHIFAVKNFSERRKTFDRTFPVWTARL